MRNQITSSKQTSLTKPPSPLGGGGVINSEYDSTEPDKIDSEHDGKELDEIAVRLDETLAKRIKHYRICWNLLFLATILSLALLAAIVPYSVPTMVRVILSIFFIIFANLTTSYGRISHKLADYWARLLIDQDAVIKELTSDEQSPEQGLEKFLRKLHNMETIPSMAASIVSYLVISMIINITFK